MKGFFLWIIIGLMMPALALAAPDYIQFKPLDEVVRTKVSNVRSGTKVLPVITWGGDIATIYANGSAADTQKNSYIGKAGLQYIIKREDEFANQVRNYLSGRTPFLRGTMGMLTSASDILQNDPRTKPVVFYQLTWSSGGDALVVKNTIKTAKDLKGKTIAVQAYGPHVDYLNRVLKDAGLSTNDVTIKWLPDLTGTDNSPMAALYEKDIDAAFVIIPDALALTSGGNVGTGSEDSVKGAKILMSTKTANRVIADVYAVRADYYEKNKDEIEKLTTALMRAEEDLADLVANRSAKQSKYINVMGPAADILLDSMQAIPDVEGLYADCEFVHASGNQKFFSDQANRRSFANLVDESSQALNNMGLIKRPSALLNASLDYKKLAVGLSGKDNSETPRFNKNKVSKLVTRKQQQGTLADGELYSFEVFFAPNQNQFSADLYANEFDNVVELASTYGGAVITVEGHSDPMGYLRAKKKGQPPVVLGRIKQSARNLSGSRAQAVISSITDFAGAQGVTLDASQFEPLGHGISQPATGICGNDPCAPENEKQWRSNMRVVFRIIQVEAESDVFMPL
ncbi:ABC transporter substrate-binding protein [Bacterioplanoides sp.]|uniref:ABC transporter substrate-binding protein n=1 Tax=Bacterioplanoides sp. TaxID=2066072 RepID=UPI003AFFC350